MEIKLNVVKMLSGPEYQQVSKEIENIWKVKKKKIK